jgi:two-component system cell cycle response regulator DivK
MATILVVEDNPQNLKLAQLVLQKSGHTVIAAADGEQGLKMAAQHQPDLILMDVQMPGMDGLEATRRLKREPRTSQIRIIALTALAMKGDAERILAAGCDAYLAKPYHYQQLMDAVTKALE